jgi:hypothetical protein
MGPGTSKRRHARCLICSGVFLALTVATALDSLTVFLDPQYELQKFVYHRKDESRWERTVFYGQLEHIVKCIIPICPALRITEPRLLLLALVTPCITEGGDATKHLITYQKMKPSPQVIDLNAISSVVGRFPYGTINGKFAIVDRSTSWARTVFVNDQVHSIDGGET